MRLTGISFKPVKNTPSIRIGRYTFVFSRYFWLNTKIAVEVRRVLGVWIVKEL